MAARSFNSQSPGREVDVDRKHNTFSMQSRRLKDTLACRMATSFGFAVAVQTHRRTDNSGDWRDNSQ